MNVAELARKMVAAAATGETEWLSHESFVNRFSENGFFPDNLNNLPNELEGLGWNIVPAIIKNWEILENGEESGTPVGYRLEKI